MESEHFIRGFKEQAERSLKRASFFQWRKKNRLKAWIEMCKIILEEE